MYLPLTQERTSIKYTQKHKSGEMTMKWLLVMCVYSTTLLFDSGRCDTDLAATATELSYNERYNEIVKPSFIETINKQLPKEGKFFDDFDCKHARTDGRNDGCAWDRYRIQGLRCTCAAMWTTDTNPVYSNRHACVYIARTARVRVVAYVGGYVFTSGIRSNSALYFSLSLVMSARWRWKYFCQHTRALRAFVHLHIIYSYVAVKSYSFGVS